MVTVSDSPLTAVLKEADAWVKEVDTVETEDDTEERRSELAVTSAVKLVMELDNAVIESVAVAREVLRMDKEERMVVVISAVMEDNELLITIVTLESMVLTLLEREVSELVIRERDMECEV